MHSESKSMNCTRYIHRYTSNYKWKWPAFVRMVFIRFSNFVIVDLIVSMGSNITLELKYRITDWKKNTTAHLCFFLFPKFSHMMQLWYCKIQYFDLSWILCSIEFLPIELCFFHCFLFILEFDNYFCVSFGVEHEWTFKLTRWIIEMNITAESNSQICVCVLCLASLTVGLKNLRIPYVISFVYDHKSNYRRHLFICWMNKLFSCSMLLLDRKFNASISLKYTCIDVCELKRILPTQEMRIFSVWFNWSHIY